ncbi:MAG: hypothetical protein E6H66_25780 [Betaproteobacteria bacterium]|nr:MAG: hypothetical protein E6H66_25780 [Betaproteobacteria bacterium]
MGHSFMSSADWAIQDNNQDADQEFSFSWARRYFYRALTTPGVASAPDGRNEQWGRLFQTLGQVIHHLQDMTQPQHVRNDAHWDGASFLGDLTNVGFRHPSRFEKYSGFSNQGQAKVEEQLANGSFEAVFPKYRQVLRNARDFWTGSAGVADYTNANFVSQRTNFVADSAGRVLAHPDFSQPTPIRGADLSVVEAFGSDPVPPTIRQFCANVGVDQCTMTFYSSVVTDNLDGATLVNARSSTESVFDEDLRVVLRYSYLNETFGTSRIFALNQLNFAAVYPFLIPKAVNYSAGMLNYFFRGRISIAPPEAGVYAVADQSTENCPDHCGFRRIRAQITNSTPEEAMAGGLVSAIAKYHRNTCYRPDFEGTPPSLGCRTADEEISVSRPVLLESPLSSGERRELSFDFDTSIPINATDVFLQVLFEGTLGSEPHAVAMGTKDISEPTFITTYNDTDYVAMPKGCYKAEAIAANDALWNLLAPLCRDTSGGTRRVSAYCANVPLNVRYTGGPAEQPWVVAMERGADGDRRVPPRRLARFAMLADTASPVGMKLGFNNPPLYLPDDGALQFPIYELEERLDGSRVEGIYMPVRGVNAWESVAFIIDGTTGNVGSSCPQQADALMENERPPVPAAITGW